MHRACANWSSSHDRRAHADAGCGKLVFQRDLTLAWRRWTKSPAADLLRRRHDDVPLATTPDLSALREIGAASCGSRPCSRRCSRSSLFRADVEDGTTEQWVLSGQPLGYLLLAKVAAHWVLTGLPLVIMSPIVGTGLGCPPAPGAC